MRMCEMNNFSVPMDARVVLSKLKCIELLETTPATEHSRILVEFGFEPRAEPVAGVGPEKEQVVLSVFCES